MELKHSLHCPRASLPIYLITCSSPHRTSKEGDILHSLGHFLLTIGVDFTSHGSLFKAAIYHSLGFYSHGLNSQAHFLSHQLISVSLHGSSFHLAIVYICDSVEHIILLPKRKIPPDIIIYLGEVQMHSIRMFLHRRTKIVHLLLHSAANYNIVFLQVILQIGSFFFS